MRPPEITQDSKHLIILSMAMASDTESVLEVRTDDDVSRDKQLLENVEDRLLTLSDQIALFNRVLVDLKDLRGVLERKSLQGESLQLEE